MKKLLPYILILFILTGFFSPIMKINAAGVVPPTTTTTGTTATENKNYQLLAPLPCTDNAQGCTDGLLKTYDPTQNNNIAGYINMMIKLFIGICAVLAVIMIVMGGIEYMTSELPGMKSEGKDRIIHAILGLLLALGAWTLLNAINPHLFDADLKSLANVIVEVELNADIPQATPPPGGKYADGSIVGTPWKPELSPTILPNGVAMNNPECATVGQKNCTSTKGLNLTIITKVKDNCTGCELVITGGTESWEHSARSTHKPGSPTIDLRVNTKLNNYITGGETPVNMKRYTTKDGVSYLYEGDHWHVYM